MSRKVRKKNGKRKKKGCQTTLMNKMQRVFSGAVCFVYIVALTAFVMVNAARTVHRVVISNQY